MLILPVDSTPDRRFQILLGENLLTVRTYWNPTVPMWYMDLSASNGDSLARGLALVPLINVLEAETELTRTLGQFRMIPLENASEVASADSLGRTGRLWWFAPGEWEANEVPQSIITTLPFDVASMYSLDPHGSAPLLRYDGFALYDGTFFFDGVLTP